MIEPLHDVMHLLVGQRIQGGAFGHILAKQPVGVLIESAFPSMIGTGKIDGGVQRLADGGMVLPSAVSISAATGSACRLCPAALLERRSTKETSPITKIADATFFVDNTLNADAVFNLAAPIGAFLAYIF